MGGGLNEFHFKNKYIIINMQLLRFNKHHRKFLYPPKGQDHHHHMNHLIRTLQIIAYYCGRTNSEGHTFLCSCSPMGYCCTGSPHLTPLARIHRNGTYSAQAKEGSYSSHAATLAYRLEYKSDLF